MKILNLVVFCLSVAMGPVAIASSSASRASRTFQIVYAEDSQWFVDWIREEPGRLPERIGHRTFSTRREAQGFASASLSKAALALETPRLLSLREVSSEKPVTEVPGGALWRAPEQWSWDWERRYSHWVAANIAPAFMTKHQIATDCADVAFAVRWIFARIHGLPAANHLSGSGKLFTNESLKSEWATLPTADLWYEDQRFLAALNYLLDLTYTHTLGRDSYPIAIAPEAFLSGTHHLQLGDTSGHTYLVNRVDLTDQSSEPIRVIYSSVPRVVRDLWQNGYWDMAQPPKGRGGFLKMRWPSRISSDEWSLVAAEEMPFFSDEQYSPEFLSGKSSFAEAVMIKLNPKLDFLGRVAEGIEHLVQQLKTRSEVVEEGFKVCQREACERGSENYENWSTPSRDKRIKELADQLENLVGALQARIPQVGSLWSQAKRESKVETGESVSTLGKVLLAWKYDTFSYDPKRSVSERWGIEPSAYVGALSAGLKQLFVEREKIISEQGAECAAAGSCEPGSGSFNRFHTYDVDSRIQSRANALEHYCAESSDQECSAAGTRMREVLIDGSGSTRSLAEWLNFAVWLNSDPRVSSEDRWGARRSQYRSLFLSPDTGLSVSRLGIAMLTFQKGERQDWKLLDIPNDREIPLPASFGMPLLDATSDLWAASETLDENLAKIRVYKGEQFTGYERVTAAGLPRWVSAGILSFPTPAGPTQSRTTQSGLLADLVDFRPSPWKEYPGIPAESQKMPVFMNSFVPPGIWIAESEAGKFEIVDVRGDQIVRTPIQWNAAKSFPFLMTWESGPWVSVLAAQCNDKECRQWQISGSVVIEKNTGKVIREFGVETNIWVSANGKYAFVFSMNNGGEVQFVAVSPDFTFTLIRKLGQQMVGASMIDGRIYFGVTQGSGKAFYSFANDTLEDFKFLSDEMEAQSIHGSYVVVKTSNGRHRVRRLGEDDTRFEAGAGVKLAFFADASLSEEFLEVRYSEGEPWSAIYDLNDASQPLITLSRGAALGESDPVILIGRVSSDVVNRGTVLKLPAGKLWLEKTDIN